MGSVLYTPDDNKSKNPRLPYLEVILGDINDPSHMVLSRPSGSSPAINGPSYITSFEYRRRTRNFSAGEFTLNLFDPTYDVLNVLHYTLNQDALSDAPLGSINFCFGYFDNTGVFHGVGVPNSVTGFASYLRGIVLKVRTKVSRRGLNLTLTGFDLDMTTSADSFSYNVFNPESIPSGQTAHAFFQTQMESLFDASGGVAIEWSPETLGQDIPATEISTFLASAQSTYRYRNTNTNAVLFRNLAQIIEDFFLSKNTGVRVILQGGISASESNPAQTYVKIKHIASDVERRARFFVDTTVDDEGSGNFSDVESFDVTLDGFTPAMMGLADARAELCDPETREWQESELSMAESAPVTVGDNVLAPGSEVSPWQTPGMESVFDAQTGMHYLVQTETDATRQSRVMTVAQWQQIVKMRQHNLGIIPVQATMRLQYPEASLLEPFSMVEVLTPTPNGRMFPFAGVYMITDISFSLAPGVYTSSLSLQKMGPIERPKEPAVEMAGEHVAESSGE